MHWYKKNPPCVIDLKQKIIEKAVCQWHALRLESLLMCYLLYIRSKTFWGTVLLENNQRRTASLTLRKSPAWEYGRGQRRRRWAQDCSLLSGSCPSLSREISRAEPMSPLLDPHGEPSAVSHIPHTHTHTGMKLTCCSSMHTLHYATTHHSTSLSLSIATCWESYIHFSALLWVCHSNIKTG